MIPLELKLRPELDLSVFDLHLFFPSWLKLTYTYLHHTCYISDERCRWEHEDE